MNLYTMSFFHPYGGYYTNNSQRQRYHYQSSASIDRTQMARVLPPVMVCSGSVAASSNNMIYTKETSGSRPDDKLQLRDHLLDISEVALELEKLKIAVEEKIRKYKKVVKQYEKKLNEVDRADAWDVIRIMVTEEHRINRTFNTINEFLDHWFYTCHDYQEDSNRQGERYNQKSTKTFFLFLIIPLLLILSIHHYPHNNTIYSLKRHFIIRISFFFMKTITGFFLPIHSGIELIFRSRGHCRHWFV